MTFSTTRDGLLYQLILNNCEMFLGDHVFLDIISQENKDGYKVHVLKTEHGKRSAQLSSSTGSTLHEALEDLHRKSAQAVDQYITANGFQAVPRVTVRTSRRRGRGLGGEMVASSRSSSRSRSRSTRLEESEIICVDGSSSSSSSGSDSDDEYTGARRYHPKTPGNAALAVRPLGPGQRQPHRLSHPTFAAGPSQAPVITRYHAAPGPSFIGPMPPTGPGTTASSRKTPRASPPLPLPLPPAPPLPHHASHTVAPRPSLKFHKGRVQNVTLCINWIGHGELNVLDQCPLSITAFMARAMDLVQAKASDFPDVASSDLAAVQSGAMKATVKRLHIAGKIYQVANVADDLTELFGMSSRPRIDIDVVLLRPALGLYPSTQPLPESSGSTGSLP